ncbi:MAG: hypothetical protein VYC39_03740 [Myxococcota bacterium]|nr:hypothetical protein [Myxococcota bacterium]
MSSRSNSDVILLSQKSFWTCFSIALFVFLFGGESLLENPFRIDKAILSSYLVLPVLVLIAHLIEKNHRLTSYLITTIELTCLKFATTYLIATALWIHAGDPPSTESTTRTSKSRRRIEKKPTKIPLEELATLSGVVVDRNKEPLVGTLVYIDSGLENIVFRTETSTKRITHNGERFEPWLTVLQTNQALIATSEDLTLHTLLDSYPVLPKISTANLNGRHNVIRISQSMKPKPIRCGVHSNHVKTSTSYIAVFEHPFAQQVNSKGQFRFEKIPALSVGLSVWHPNFGTRQFNVKLKKGQSLSKSLIITD